MIADLPMYDWSAIRAATDAFWAEVARRLEARGIEAPAALARNPDFAASWRDPDLLLGQTCGMPFVSGHCGEAASLPPVAGLPLAVVPADDGEYAQIRELARSAAAERFAPGVPDMPEL